MFLLLTQGFGFRYRLRVKSTWWCDFRLKRPNEVLWSRRFCLTCLKIMTFQLSRDQTRRKTCYISFLPFVFLPSNSEKRHHKSVFAKSELLKTPTAREI